MIAERSEAIKNDKRRQKLYRRGCVDEVQNRTLGVVLQRHKYTDHQQDNKSW